MILLLGASGFVGSAFAAELKRRRLPFQGLSRAILDYTHFDTLFDHVRKSRPEFVINAAGFTGGPNPARCEIARAEAVQANTLLPQTISRVCYLTQTPWAHISSGGIFSGGKIIENGNTRIVRNASESELCRRLIENSASVNGFSETDQPNSTFHCQPCSFYGGTKALAEESMQKSEQMYLLRPSVLIDETEHPRNLLSRIHGWKPAHDVALSISHRQDLVRACLDLWKTRAAFGTYHVVNPGALTLQTIINARDRVLGANAVAFDSVDHDSSGALEQRLESHSVLDGSKLEGAGIRLRSAAEALETSLLNWQPTRENRSEKVSS